MNELIRKLAEEANVRPLYSPAYAPRYIFEEEDLEKFAELIIEEACRALDAYDDFLKKHFGVEEWLNLMIGWK